MNFTEVKKLVKLVESSEIHELELERDGTKLRVCKAEPKVVETVVAQAAPAPAALPAAAPAAPVAAEAPVSAPAAGKDLYELKSPIVGTFYRAPAPDADPYIKVGDQVKPGQTLCIVEAMKLMNEIECDVNGRVAEIVLENQDPVEFGQVLFRIDTQG